MKKLLFPIFIILFINSSIAGNKENNIFTESKADPQANRVVITWITKDENNVKTFVIKRSNDDKVFIELDRVNPKGPGYRYEYIDDDVFFHGNGALFYKVEAIGSNNASMEDSGSMMVHPNLTGMFQTWGAIKAMFR